MDEEVVYIKVFDEAGDVVFEGKVSSDIVPHELLKLRCFLERVLNTICNKRTNVRIESFKGSQDAELVVSHGSYDDFSGVLYVDADGVLRTSKRVPSCECVMMSLWELSHEECKKVFKCETLEELEINYGTLRQIPCEIGKMKKLKKLRLSGLRELAGIPEEIGELSSLKELWIEWSGIESLPKSLQELTMLKSIHLLDLSDLQFHAEDVVVFSKLNHLTITSCNRPFTPSFAKAFFEMIKTTVFLRCLDLDWHYQKRNREIVVAALQENGSIVDGGWNSGCEEYFKRNKTNHESASDSILWLLAIRRWKDALISVPKEIIRMLAMMLWHTRCDVKSWSKH